MAVNCPARRRNQRCLRKVGKKEFEEFKESQEFKEGIADERSLPSRLNAQARRVAIPGAGAANVGSHGYFHPVRACAATPTPLLELLSITDLSFAIGDELHQSLATFAGTNRINESYESGC